MNKRNTLAEQDNVNREAIDKDTFRRFCEYSLGFMSREQYIGSLVTKQISDIEEAKTEAKIELLVEASENRENIDLWIMDSLTNLIESEEHATSKM